jgi:hypothetical protein
MKGLDQSGSRKQGAETKAILSLSKAAWHSGVQTNLTLFLVRLLRGAEIFAKPSMKCLK